MNKTGFGISKVKKTVSQKARKHSYTRSISTTSHITANICVFASRRVLPSSAMYENCFLIKWNIQSEHTECKQYCLNLRHSDSSINILNRMCHRGRWADEKVTDIFYWRSRIRATLIFRIAKWLLAAKMNKTITMNENVFISCYYLPCINSFCL